MDYLINGSVPEMEPPARAGPLWDSVRFVIAQHTLLLSDGDGQTVQVPVWLATEDAQTILRETCARHGFELLAADRSPVETVVELNLDDLAQLLGDQLGKSLDSKDEEENHDQQHEHGG